MSVPSVECPAFGGRAGAAKDREIARLREALIAVMNCPDIREYIGSQVSRFADDALAPKESGNG